MNVPVAMIIFNRPSTTGVVFSAVAKAKPKKLLVAADGPRSDHPDDEKKCAEARAIVERVDWDCDVYKLYSDINLGCGHGPVNGINWVFEQVDEAIILEDDCVPHLSFFPYCEALLEKYRDDERVMHINGRSNFPVPPKSKYSYYFSRSLSGLGWATWTRAWKYYDIAIKLWSELRDTRFLYETIGDRREEKYHADKFDRIFARAGDINYWDHQWNFACWSQNGLGIRPYNNLIYYIGFEEGTGEYLLDTSHIDFPTTEMKFPIKHPPYVVRDTDADQYDTDRFFKALAKKKRRQYFHRVQQKVSNRLAKLVSGHQKAA